MIRLACLLLTLALFVPGPAGAAAPDLAAIAPAVRAPNDSAEMRRLVLPNGMKVLLLSDPKLNNSAASLAVGVGYYSDPPQRPGLAHFLEHMLFLGTRKYPDVADYSGYLGRNGGDSNAYTAGDRTNYHFEIRHEAFEGALDRFSQFFVEPLFDPRFTERELNAVHSEHQKNLENDFWREHQLRARHYKAGHPAGAFGTGSKDTLAGTTRDELLAFYRRHYSANRMTLALAGRASLDQLEQWARRYFGPVEDRKAAAVGLPAEYLAPKPALRLLRMEPIKDLRHLHLEFPLPALHASWPGKPAELVGFVLGSEGPGSLLAQLKREDLATALMAGAQPSAPEFGAFEMQISLTPKGLQQLPRVFGLVFAAIAQLRERGLPPHLFGERQALARLDEQYRDKGEGSERVVGLANLLLDYPIEVAERVPYLWLAPDPQGTAALLARLRPDNLLATLVAKGQATDRTEPIYGTRYAYTEEAGPAYAALLQPPAVPTLALPPPNPYVPSRTALLPLQPARLIDEPGLVLHHAQDSEFQRPMAAHQWRLRLPRSIADARNAVLLRLYEACVREALNETTYTAAEAGVHFGFSAGLDGVMLSVDGYDESAARLLDLLGTRLVDFELPEARFAALKERLLRELAAFEHADAYQTIGETRRSVQREFHWRPDEQLPIARAITLEQVRAFARSLYAQGRIEALSFGNLGADEAVRQTRALAAALRVAPVPGAQLMRRRLLALAPGEAVRSSEQLQVNNSAFRREYELGTDSAELRAATLLLSAFVADPFYNELRTRQQLGYIVAAGTAEDEKRHFLYFLVQSGDHPADELETRADAFIAGLPSQLKALPADEWQALVGGARAKLEEKDKSIAERAQRLFYLAYERDGEWGRRARTLAALEGLTQARTAEILAGALAPATRRMSSYLGFARQHQPARPPAVSFTDRAQWKGTRRYE